MGRGDDRHPADLADILAGELCGVPGGDIADIDTLFAKTLITLQSPGS